MDRQSGLSNPIEIQFHQETYRENMARLKEQLAEKLISTHRDNRKNQQQQHSGRRRYHQRNVTSIKGGVSLLQVKERNVAHAKPNKQQAIFSRHRNPYAKKADTCDDVLDVASDDADDKSSSSGGRNRMMIKKKNKNETEHLVLAD